MECEKKKSHNKSTVNTHAQCTQSKCLCASGARELGEGHSKFDAALACKDIGCVHDMRHHRRSSKKRR